MSTSPDDSLIEPISLGASYESFADFEVALDRWRTEYGHNFRIASSEQLKTTNKENLTIYRYRYVVFNCVHYGEPRIRGTGVRPNQTYLSCGCRATLRLSFIIDDEVMRIVKLIDDHTGHSLEPHAMKVSKFWPNRAKKVEVSDDEHQQQIQYVIELKKQQENNLKMLRDRRSQAGLSQLAVNFPPICRETIPFIQRLLKDSTLMSKSDYDELYEVSLKMMEQKISYHFDRMDDIYAPDTPSSCETKPDSSD